jgi:hypothetical protein
MHDSEKIALGIAQAKGKGREIDDLTAKIIAAQFHDGSLRALAFLSTGIVWPSQGAPVPAGCGTPLGPVSALWNAIASDYDKHTRSEREALDWLGTYLVNRKTHEEVEGWADLSW